MRLQQGFTTGGMGSDGHFARQQSSGPNVRFGSKADMTAIPIDVRFTPKSRHRNSTARRPLCAKSGHWTMWLGEVSKAYSVAGTRRAEAHHQRRMTQAKSVRRASILRCGCADRTCRSHMMMSGGSDKSVDARGESSNHRRQQRDWP